MKTLRILFPFTKRRKLQTVRPFDIIRLMLKRIMFTLMVLLVIYSGVLVGFRIFEPEQTDAGSESAIATVSLDYETLKEYTRSTGNSTMHYYFFCTVDSNDCLYLENTVLKSVNNETENDLMSLIEFVDLSGIDEKQLTTRLKNEWGVSVYPAFVACRNDNGEIVIDNTLEWNPQQPISIDDFRQWLALNKLYDDYDILQPIETPSS